MTGAWSRRRTYSEMSPAQQAQFHAKVYAFRHVHLGEPLAAGSPCDPAGDWFDLQAARRAVDVFRSAIAQSPQKRRRREYYAKAAAEGAEIADAWARDHDYQDRHAAYDDGVTCFDIARDIVGKPKRMPGPAHGRWEPTHQALQQLGVTATERKWTPEEMLKSRQDLGIPEPSDNATSPARRRRRGAR